MLNAILYHISVERSTNKQNTENGTKAEEKPKIVYARVCLFHYGGMLNFVSFAFNYEHSLFMATMTFFPKKKVKVDG